VRLEKAAEHVDREVIYRPPGGGERERGVITSVNDTWVFVRYEGQLSSAATHPANLTLAKKRSES